MTTRHRILLATAGLILASITQLALTASVARQRATAFAVLERANSQTADIAEVGRLVAVMRATQRGYLLTGAASFRDEYTATHKALHARLDSLAGLLSTSEHQQDVRAIGRAVDDWHDNVTSGLFARVSAEGHGGLDLADVILREGLPRVKVIETAMARFSDELKRETDASIDSALTSIERGMSILLVLPFVSVAVFIFLASYLYRQVLRPIRHFTEASARISAGDYDVTVPVSPREDELASFGRAFDAMRRDVSLREEALQSERGRLSLVVDSAPVALALYDHEGQVFLQNASADRLFGPRVVDGVTSRAVPPPDSRRFDGRPLEPGHWPPQRALAGETVAGDEVVFATPDGRRVPVIASAVPLRETSGRLVGAVAVYQDVSHRFELDRVKDDFVSVVSHELRTPLTSMRGALQLALDPSTDQAERAALLAIALSNTERLVRMVNDILDVAKIEAGKLTLNLGLTPVSGLIDTAVSAVQMLANQAGVSLRVSVAPEVPLIMVDTDRVVRAIVNLLSNAVKFSPSGAAVEIIANARAGCVDITVSDRGPGIHPDKIKLLFERFQQLEDIDIRRNQGTGLGLTITRGIAEAHGGSVDVQSTPGEGARFTITLPVVPPPEVAQR